MQIVKHFYYVAVVGKKLEMFWMMALTAFI